MNRFFKFVSSIFSNSTDDDLAKAERQYAEYLRLCGQASGRALLAQAPKFHSGGVPTLAPGEVPIILKKAAAEPQLPAKKRGVKALNRKLRKPNKYEGII